MIATKLRVMDLQPRDGVFNTAFDLFLLKEAEQGKFTLGFTKWLPSVVIGSSQSLALDVNLEECRRRGISVVRRFSGGQAVFLDENYIVWTLAGERKIFPNDLDVLREQMCQAVIRALRQINIPAEFFPPDNLVVSNPHIKTLGNSGQVIKRDVIAISASVRYELSESSLRQMLTCLKTNGKSLVDFFEPAKRYLASIKEFTRVSPDLVKELIIKEIATTYGCDSWFSTALSQEDYEEVSQFVNSVIARLEDRPIYVSRGVCYFFLGGRCIVPEISEFLPLNKPSTVLDSTII